MTGVDQLIDRATTAKAKKNGDAVALAGFVHDLVYQAETLRALVDTWREIAERHISREESDRVDAENRRAS